MKAKDVMTQHVITVTPDAPILEALRLMLDNRISGLPVVDTNGNLAGIVTEGDFLRRSETGTERRRPRWVEFLLGPGTLAKDYVRAHARRIDEVMTDDVKTIAEDADLGAVVALMEKHRIKRLPVVRGNAVVGIVSRANLLHALASLARETGPSPKTDEAIRAAVLAELDARSWAPRRMIDVVVRNGIVELWGTVIDPGQRDAARVAAETVPGVRAVKCHIVWVEPMSGMAFCDPQDESNQANAAPLSPSTPPPIRAAAS
jgi:CBS domain-containing protein